jgi:hypothetical protein
MISPTGSATLDTTAIPNGAHVLTARATDAAGNTGFNSINITISNVIPDTTPPVVTFVSPADGATVFGSTPIQVSASDNSGVQSVSIFLDGVEIAAGPMTQWNTASVPNGTHTLSAKAIDAAGNVGTSAVAVVVNNVDTIAPSIQIIWPTAGMTIPRGEVLLTCAATDNIGVAAVQWQVDGLNIGPEVILPPYSSKWNSSTISGKGWHTLTAIARDAGGLKTTSEPVRFRIQ